MTGDTDCPQAGIATSQTKLSIQKGVAQEEPETVISRETNRDRPPECLTVNYDEKTLYGNNSNDVSASGVGVTAGGTGSPVG